MKISAIEIGTNSSKFAVAEADQDRQVTIVKKCSDVNRLSKEMYKDNLINREAMENGIKIIGEYIEQSRRDKARLISIFSTSVLRDAKNSDEFIHLVKEAYGMDIEIIAGEAEAYYSFSACRSLMEESGNPYGVIDIGGGSTEIIIGSKNNIMEKLSLNIGAARLSEMFVTSDPIGEYEMIKILHEIRNKFSYFTGVGSSKLRLIGTGGTVRSIGTVLLDIDYRAERDVHGVKASRKDIEKISWKLAAFPLEERKKIIGLNPKRADSIVPGILILLSAMESLGTEEVTISSLGVIEGFLSDYFLRNL